MTRAPTLTPLEIAAGMPLYPHGARGGGERSTLAAASPVAAFADVIRPALERPPCLVSFSGGRDSSAVLAVAAAVARADGLLPPVPATTRFAAAADADEATWQEEVVRHLGLQDWIRHDVHDDFDCIGPLATSVLRRHGLLWPPNTHFHEPLLRAATGGSLLTGIGGDEVFSTPRWGRAAAVLAGRARPVPRDILRITLGLAPVPVRRRMLLRGGEPELPWLLPGALAEVTRRLADEAAREPVAWHKRFRWLRSLAYTQVGLACLDVLARDLDVRIVHPFFEPPFLDAVAALPRRVRFETRTEAMRLLFRDHLPSAILERRGKARFDRPLVGAYSRAFGERWDGTGVDADLVDITLVRDRWRRGLLAGTETLLQQAWLVSEGKGLPPRDLGDRAARRAE